MQLEPDAVKVTGGCAGKILSQIVLIAMQPSTESTSVHPLLAPLVPADEAVVMPATLMPPTREAEVQASPAGSTPSEPGSLLADLNRRQDEVLEQLDELDAKLIEVLKGLGATMDDEAA